MTKEEFLAEIEKRAAKAGLAPSTYCERAGQGGRFYVGLRDEGKRCWPETMEKVLSLSLPDK